MSSKNAKKRRATTTNDSPRRGPPPAAYYDYHSDSDCEAELDPEEMKADREVYNSVGEDQRQRAALLLRQLMLIAERSPDQSPSAMLKQMLCLVGPVAPGMPKDPRSVLGGSWEITPQDVPDLAEPAAFWQRDVKDAIRAQTSATGPIELDIFVGRAPFKMLGNPKLTSWVVLGRVREPKKPPGEPFVLSVFSGSGKPSAQVLLGPLCEQLRELPTVKVRVLLANAEARVLTKETVTQKGYYGCHKCIIEGEKIDDNVSFHSDTPFPARTHAKFVGHRYDDTHRTAGDPTQMTPLALEHLGLDIIKGVIVGDDRHLLHIGAAKNFWQIFTTKTEMSEKKYNRLQSLMCKVRFPHERKDGQFVTNLFHWTPSMWGYLMDVVGFVVLKHVLSPEKYELYCMLHWAVAICNRTRNRSLLQYAKQLFKRYVSNYKTFVGFVPCNIHYLQHVVDEVREFGPLPGQSTNAFVADVIGLKRNVKTIVPRQVSRITATALRLREEARRPPPVLDGSYPTVTNEGRRVEIKEKFLLRCETISATDANSWFLVETEDRKDLEVVKFEKALASELDSGSLVVLGRPLATAAIKLFEHPVKVPAALNVFGAENKQALKEAQSYRVSDMVCKLCVVDLGNYTSFVPLIESFAELFE